MRWSRPCLFRSLERCFPSSESVCYIFISYVLQVCTCVAFSPSSPFASTSSSTVTEQDPIPLLCAVGYSDGTVRVCSIASGKVVAKLQPHQSSVRTITYSPDGAHHYFPFTSSHFQFLSLSFSPMLPIPLSHSLPFVLLSPL